jgi:type IV secretion system protein VirB10
MGMNGMAMPTISPTNPSPDKLASAENKWANQTHDKASIITTTPMVPSTPYFLNAGHIIPAVLSTKIDTDNPGMVQAVVTHDVYNDDPGHENEILIPSGSSLVGKYNNTVNFGQTRVQVQWTQVILPTGTVLPIKGEGESKTGASGFHDQVNNHYLKIFGGVMLLTLMDTGPMLATPSYSTSQLSGGGVSSMLGENLGMNASEVGMQYSSNLMNLAPTLTIRNGYPFNVVIPSTITFPSYYSTVHSEK